jgi:hypothetical protein
MVSVTCWVSARDRKLEGGRGTAPAASKMETVEASAAAPAANLRKRLRVSFKTHLWGLRHGGNFKDMYVLPCIVSSVKMAFLLEITCEHQGEKRFLTFRGDDSPLSEMTI